MASCQKLDIILVIKGFRIWCYQKMSITKKCAPKLVFFNEKKMRKIPMIFDIENESEILTLFDTSPLQQFLKFENWCNG